MKSLLVCLIVLASMSAKAVSIESSRLNNQGKDLVEEVLSALEEARKKQQEESGMMSRIKNLKEDYDKVKELEKTDPERAKVLMEQLKKQVTQGGEQQELIKLNPEDLNPAVEKFLMAIGLEPNYLLYRFNLASTLQLQGKLDEAKKEYELLLKHVTGDFKYSVLFNRAILSAQMKKNDEALNFYQQALEIKPKSIQVKTNIELLLQQQQNQQNQQGDGENNEQDKENQDGKDKKNKNKKYDDGRKKQKLKKPKSLSEKEIKKIMNELRNQEQKIRAKDMKDNFKEQPREKDW